MSTKKYSITDTKAYSFSAPEKGQVIYWDTKQAGLGLRITSAGSRSWIVQGYVNGKSRRFTLGLLDDLRYQEARDEAGKVRGKMRKGINPLVEKRKQQQSSEAEGVTLREIMEDYIQHKRTKHGPLRPSTKQGIRQNVESDFAGWADKPVATINREVVVKKFRELSKSAPTQTNLAFRNLRALLNWAREKYSTSDGTYTILPLNPVSQALKQNGLVQWNKEKARVSRIPKGRIGEVWLLLEEYANSDRQIATTCTSADLIAFMILTGCRISEANQLTWDRVKLDGELPTFHLDITKNHNPITLPISDALHTVLARRYNARLKGRSYVFPAVRGKKGFLHDPRAMMKRVIEVAGVNLSPHDMRRTFEDIAEFAGVDSDRRRVLINHIGGDVHSVNYANNSDPEILMVEAQKVSKWVLRQAEIARNARKGGNVIPLKASK